VGIRFAERWQKGVFDSAFTIGAVALASLIHFALGEQFAGRTPFLVSILAVMVSAMRGGLVQGLLATALSLGVEITVWGEWAWLRPDLGSSHFTETVLYLIEGLVISLLAEYSLNGWIALRRASTTFPVEGTGRRIYDQDTPVRATVLHDLVEARVAERTSALTEMVADLRATLENIKTLTGLLAICGSCKRIREDDGSWSQVEDYIRAHSNAEFSHSLCPDCLATLREEIAERQRGQEDDPPL
jgi:hypothetical protein